MATTARNPDRRERPQTRDAILGRAVNLASLEGLEGLTIGRLAAEVGMSKSGLFRHFGSKEELQLATVETAARCFLADVVEPALKEPSGAARLRALCDLYLDHLEYQVFAGGCFWAAASAEFDDRPGAVHDAVRGAMAAWLQLLSDQARATGADDPEQLAFELQSMVQGANTHWRLLDDPRAFDRARAAISRRLED